MKLHLTFLIILLALIFESEASYAQEVVSLKGKIVDKTTNELIPYANVYDSINNIFAATDSNGFFELKLTVGKYNIQFSIVGYETILKEVNLTQNTNLQIELKPDIHLGWFPLAYYYLQKLLHFVNFFPMLHPSICS